MRKLVSLIVLLLVPAPVAPAQEYNLSKFGTFAPPRESTAPSLNEVRVGSLFLFVKCLPPGQAKNDQFDLINDMWETMAFAGPGFHPCNIGEYSRPSNPTTLPDGMLERPDLAPFEEMPALEKGAVVALIARRHMAPGEYRPDVHGIIAQRTFRLKRDSAGKGTCEEFAVWLKAHQRLLTEPLLPLEQDPYYRTYGGLLHSYQVPPDGHLTEENGYSLFLWFETLPPGPFQKTQAVWLNVADRARRGSKRLSLAWCNMGEVFEPKEEGRSTLPLAIQAVPDWAPVSYRESMRMGRIVGQLVFIRHQKGDVFPLIESELTPAQVLPKDEEGIIAWINEQSEKVAARTLPFPAGSEPLVSLPAAPTEEESEIQPAEASTSAPMPISPMQWVLLALMGIVALTSAWLLVWHSLSAVLRWLGGIFSSSNKPQSPSLPRPAFLWRLGSGFVAGCSWIGAKLHIPRLPRPRHV